QGHRAVQGDAAHVPDIAFDTRRGIAHRRPCGGPARLMTLRFFNTLSRETEEFKPITPNHVRMYVCGITVYDYCHVGHARSQMTFDMVHRWLKTLGYRGH